MFTTNNRALFHLWWKKILVKYQNLSKYYENGCLQNFLFLFMSLLIAPIIKKQLYLGWNLLYLFKKCPKTNLKVFQPQFLISVKWSGKHFSTKGRFSTFLQLSCLNFELKLCEKIWSSKSCKRNQVWKSVARVRSKKLFPETVWIFFSFLCLY